MFDDPDYSDGFEDGFEAGEEYVFDTYDQIFDPDEIFDETNPDYDDNDYDWEMTGAEMGLVGALAEEMSEDYHYEIDDKTDQENWDKVMRMAPLSSRHQTGSKLRPFEKYVQSYIRSGFKHPDD